MPVFGQVPDWVNDWGVVIGLLVGLCSLIAFTYAFTKFAVRLMTGVFERVLDAYFTEHVPPMVEAVIAPIRAEQVRVGTNLEQHMIFETELIEQQNTALASQNAVIERHSQEDQIRFEHIDEHFEVIDNTLSEIKTRDDVAKDQRATMLALLENIQPDPSV